MKFTADFHIHSKHSAATSSQADLPHFWLWALIKGIDLVAAPDFTHPGWFKELRDQLEPDGTGLFDLKPQARKAVEQEIRDWNLDPDRKIKFLLSSEISSIYKKNAKTRKIHNLACFDSFESAERYSQKLAKLGNIAYDGRPILGVDAKDLLSIVLDVSDRNMFIPAHIWTPWFSLFGSKSGFDSIEECFEDLTPDITALETGLSSDPAMNWMVSALDRFNLVSNSDAHSPQKLGREANLFDTDLSFDAIRSSLRDKKSGKFLGTLEFFPEEGKYHNDGHRDCGINIPPEEALRLSNNCPVCGKPLTIGVLHRVLELADKEYGRRPENAKDFQSLVPLTEIIADSYGSLSAKKTEEAYKAMIRSLGPEFNILRSAEIPDIAKASNDVVAEGVKRLREGRVNRVPGFDGEFGKISIFSQEERDKLMKQDTLFAIAPKKRMKNSGKGKIVRARPEEKENAVRLAADSSQQEAVDSRSWPAAVTAGPGTGKTFVLVERIRSEVSAEPSLSGRFCAITFTTRAADELKKRLGKASDWIGTIHAICLKILRHHHPGLTVIAPAESELVLSAELGASDPVRELRRISLLKGASFPGCRPKDPMLEAYDKYLRDHKAVDFDDIVAQAADLVKSDKTTREWLSASLACVFVDEFQDVNPGQYVFVLELARLLNRKLFVIGDPDQSIYGFRGADPEIFKTLKEDFPSTSFFSLDRNFRSAEVIVKFSNRVIGGAKNSVPSEPRPGAVIKAEFPTELSEAIFIAKTISEKIGGRDMIESARRKGGGWSLNDFGVLVRTVRQTRLIADCLAREGFPLRIRDATDLVRSKEARIAVNMAKLLLDPDDAMAGLFFRKADFPFHGLFSKFTKDRDRYLKDVKALLEDLSSSVTFEDAAAYEELLSLAQAHPSAEDFLDCLLYRDPAEVEVGRRKIPREAVSVLTMHASKGLEFPVVFIAGMSEGLVPYHAEDGIGEEDLAAERRLFYVAATRARNEVFLTRSLEMKKFGRTVRTRPSRFLDEADPGIFSAVETGKFRTKNTQLELPL